VGVLVVRQRAHHGCGRTRPDFVDDVGVGDLWYFPSGIPHSIQGLEPDGVEFFWFSMMATSTKTTPFNVGDWFKHTPNEVLGKNFGAPAALFGHTPDSSERYIFAAAVRGRSARTISREQLWYRRRSATG